MKIKVLLIIAAVAAGAYYLYKRFTGAAVAETTPLSVVSPILQTAPPATKISDVANVYEDPFLIAKSNAEYYKGLTDKVASASSALAASPTILQMTTPVVTKAVAEQIKTIISPVGEKTNLIPESAINTAARAVTLSNAAVLKAQKAKAYASVVKTPASIAAARQAENDVFNTTKKARISLDRLTT